MYGNDEYARFRYDEAARKNGDPAVLDYEQINQVVDEFSGAGFGYFGTGCVYRNGKNEEAVELLRTENKMTAIAFCIESGRSACGFIRYVRAPVSAVLDCYNICQFRSNPNYGCDNIYLKNTMAEEEYPDCFGELPKEEVVLSDGTDIAETVENAEKWLIQYNCG